MKPNSNKRRANKSGAVLVTAVAVLLIMSILMTATIGYVSVNRKKTNENYSRKQAYLTASSVLQSVVTQIQLETQPGDGTSAAAAKQSANIKKICDLAAANLGEGTKQQVKINSTGDGTEYKLGTTWITISQDNGSTNNLVVTARTTYGGYTEKVAAHISVETAVKPVEFTNTIETISNEDMIKKDHWDNLLVIGDTAVLNNNGGKYYEFENQTTSNGSYYMWGSVKPGTGGANFVLRPNFTDETRGTFVEISGNYFGEISVKSTMERKDGSNFVYIGAKANFMNHAYIGDSKNQVDVITGALILDKANSADQAKYGLSEVAFNEYKQYGNVYVYKTGLLGADDGCMVVTSNNVVINGDVVIEGDLRFGSNTNDYMNNGKKLCTGTLTVGGNIYNPSGSVLSESARNKLAGGKVTVGAKITKSSRGQIPDMTPNANDYIYFPEDFFANTTPKIGVLRTAYSAFYDASTHALKDSLKISKLYTSASDEVKAGTAKFRHKITSNCIIDKGMKGQNAFMSGNGNFLVNVTNKDIVIMIENGVNFDSSTNLQFVVKNDSPLVPNKDGTKDHKYNCYFVTDNGDQIKIGEADEDGKSTSTGSKQATMSFSGLRIFEYNTYVKMYPSASQNATFTIGSDEKAEGKFVYNGTSKDISIKAKDGTPYDVYKAENSSIIILLGGPVGTVNATTGAITGRTKISMTNGSFVQASVYGPNAEFENKTQGIQIDCCDPNGELMEKYYLNGLGVFICGKFFSDNKAYYGYTKPSSQSALSLSKKSDPSNMAGFVLDRYDHY